MEMNELNLLSEYQLMSFIHLWKWTLFVVILQFLAVVQPFDFIHVFCKYKVKVLIL